MSFFTRVAVVAVALVCAFALPAAADTAPLVDWGGPVVVAAPVHVLWWGNLFDPADQATVDAFVPAFVHSDYMNVTAQYERGGPAVALGAVDVTFDPAHHPGTAPRAAQLRAEILRTYGTIDPTGVYLVLGDNLGHWNDGDACAWHDYVTTADGANVPVAYVPNEFNPNVKPGTMPAFCRRNPGPWQPVTYANTVAYAAAHELTEAVTDPMPCTALTTCVAGHGAVAWDQVLTGDGGIGEIADLCTSFTTFYALADGSSWYLPEEWSNVDAACI